MARQMGPRRIVVELLNSIRGNARFMTLIWRDLGSKDKPEQSYDEWMRLEQYATAMVEHAEKLHAFAVAQMRAVKR